MSKTYKTAIGFLRHMSYLANNQDMSDCTDWDNLSPEEQKMFYGLLAGIQNDLSELNDSLKSRGIDINKNGKD